MVRLKDRYLLVNILYPDAPTNQTKGPASDLMVFNQPTVGDIQDHALANAIRSEILALFGDCGAGSAGRSLQSMLSLCRYLDIFTFGINN